MTLQTDYVMMTITTTMMAKTTNDDCGKDDEVDEQWHEIDEKTVVRSETRLGPANISTCLWAGKNADGLLRDNSNMVAMERQRQRKITMRNRKIDNSTDSTMMKLE
ncbi:unnamed protein product [Ceratitis capitata]|uniref:(Mediterranean fruit fly) hypothetical protein n=1 Tax=Ceratitis capitata TaxID=7213 RepID=A0A811V1M9_CERCA|nr:unnamed protein product [Ceratitis capitata]